jgi:hypothetical protein
VIALLRLNLTLELFRDGEIVPKKAIANCQVTGLDCPDSAQSTEIHQIRRSSKTPQSKA